MEENSLNPGMVRILIIDDDKDLANSIRDVLHEEGFEVSVANNGREGIVMQSENPYHLIITDIIMPEEDGLEVIMWIRSFSPQTKMIAISGGGYFDSRDYLLMAKELGANMVLCKPFSMQVLKSGISRLLEVKLNV